LPGAIGSIDVIVDFNPLEDFLGLSGGLTFEDFTFEQGTGVNFRDTTITVDSGKVLAVLINVPATTLAPEDFIDPFQAPTQDTDMSEEMG
jgi:hypothetical protein